MFFGRKNELDSLERQYRAKKFEFPVIYGRRRVGKTELITHFIKDKKAIYFQGIIGTEKQNLDNFVYCLVSVNIKMKRHLRVF
jgi:AAA+ ATPase superfamily predicted ATPase